MSLFSSVFVFVFLLSFGNLHCWLESWSKCLQSVKFHHGYHLSSLNFSTDPDEGLFSRMMYITTFMAKIERLPRYRELYSWNTPALLNLQGMAYVLLLVCENKDAIGPGKKEVEIHKTEFDIQTAVSISLPKFLVLNLWMMHMHFWNLTSGFDVELLDTYFLERANI